MRRTGYAVLFLNGDSELFEDIFKRCVGYGVPSNACGLAVGDNILNAGINFFQRVAGANQNIAEGCLAGAVGHCVGIDRQAGVGSTEQVEAVSL